ncbi:MAG TPA: GPP34 family phosphoprotein, partial [Pseudonocardiaceae bacterium]
MPSRTPPDTLGRDGRGKTLPVTLCLLAWDTGKQRFAQGGELRFLLRGAALADLSLRGCVSDDEGKVRPSGTKRTGDRVLDDMLREIGDDRPRTWRAWVHRHAGRTTTAVQDQLASAHIVAVENRRVLGIFPGRRVALIDSAIAEAARAAVRDVVTGAGPVSDRDAALVALVVAG